MPQTLWNISAPLLLLTGVVAQALHAWRPTRTSFGAALVGVVMVVGYTLHERDITLTVGQMLVLPLLLKGRSLS